MVYGSNTFLRAFCSLFPRYSSLLSLRCYPATRRQQLLDRRRHPSSNRRADRNVAASASCSKGGLISLQLLTVPTCICASIPRPTQPSTNAGTVPRQGISGSRRRRSVWCWADIRTIRQACPLQSSINFATMEAMISCFSARPSYSFENFIYPLRPTYDTA